VGGSEGGRGGTTGLPSISDFLSEKECKIKEGVVVVVLSPAAVEEINDVVG
jgi:hypothetical protein